VGGGVGFWWGLLVWRGVIGGEGRGLKGRLIGELEWSSEEIWDLRLFS
jgi:hypothetical protein